MNMTKFWIIFIGLTFNCALDVTYGKKCHKKCEKTQGKITIDARQGAQFGPGLLTCNNTVFNRLGVEVNDTMTEQDFESCRVACETIYKTDKSCLAFLHWSSTNKCKLFTKLKSEMINMAKELGAPKECPAVINDCGVTEGTCKMITEPYNIKRFEVKGQSGIKKCNDDCKLQQKCYFYIFEMATGNCKLFKNPHKACTQKLGLPAELEKCDESKCPKFSTGRQGTQVSPGFSSCNNTMFNELSLSGEAVKEELAEQDFDSCRNACETYYKEENKSCKSFTHWATTNMCHLYTISVKELIKFAKEIGTAKNCQLAFQECGLTEGTCTMTMEPYYIEPMNGNNETSMQNCQKTCELQQKCNFYVFDKQTGSCKLFKSPSKSCTQKLGLPKEAECCYGENGELITNSNGGGDAGHDNDYAGLNNDYSGTNNDYSGTNNDYSGTNNDYSGTNNDYSGTNNDYSGTNNVYTGLKNDYSGTNMDYSGLKYDYSVTNNDYSVTNNDYTGLKYDYSAKNNDYSATNNDYAGFKNDKSGSKISYPMPD